MTDKTNDGELKAALVDDNVDSLIVQARIVYVMNPIEMADVEQVVPGAGETFKGEVQSHEYRDAWAAILFLFQFVCVVYVVIAYLPYIGQSDNNSTSTSSVKEVTDDVVEVIAGDTSGLMLLMSFAMAGLTTTGALSLMMRYHELIVKISFLFFPFVWVAVAFVFMATGDDTAIFFVYVAVAISVHSLFCWYFFRKQVPFAAATLRCALTALSLNSATYALSFVISITYAVTMSIFFIAFYGIQVKAESAGQELCSKLYADNTVVYAEGQMCYTNPPNGWLLIGLMFAFFWTQQVIQNIMHVTTAGVVGSWWFTAMGDQSFCSPTFTSSLLRSLTYSFGSICFGSMLVAIIQTIEELARCARSSGRGGQLINCVIQCILHFFRKYLEYFNSWAFVYVGIYGYPFIEASKNVLTLFSQRGCTTLITDTLVLRALFLCNLGIGTLSGLIVAIVCKFVIAPTLSESQETSLFIWFYIASIVGFLISRIALFPLQSAVRTVIVCSAESPAEFDEHHPDLSEMMKAAWSQTYPTIAGVWV